MDEQNILVVGAKEKALAISRSLDEKFGTIDLAYSDDSYKPAKYSKHTDTTHKFPEDKENFLKSLEELLSNKAYSLVFCTELSTLPLIVKNKQILSEYSKIGVPPKNVYECAYDKSKTIEICEKAGIPHPDTKILKLSEAEQTESWDKMPVVVKHENSEGGEGVSKARNSEELDTILKDFKRRFNQDDNILIQEYEPGTTLCAGVVCDKGEIIACCGEKRIHEINMGPPSYRESISLPQNIKEYTEKFLEESEWSGPAQIEFRTKNGRASLIEVNGRFWGSLTTPIKAGINIPKVWSDILLKDDISGEYNFRESVRTRNLIRDAEWTLEQNTGDIVKNLITASIRSLSTDETIDEFELKDPIPVIYSAKYMAGEAFTRFAD